MVAWVALATVFACLPALGGLAYFYECGHERRGPSARGYWAFVNSLHKAKAEALRDTARLLFSNKPDSAGAVGWQVSLGAWLLWLILTLVGSDHFLVLITYGLCVPGCFAAYSAGKRRSRPSPSEIASDCEQWEETHQQSTRCVGAPIATRRLCATCKSLIREGSKYCFRCGANLEHTEAQVTGTLRRCSACNIDVAVGEHCPTCGASISSRETPLYSGDAAGGRAIKRSILEVVRSMRDEQKAVRFAEIARRIDADLSGFSMIRTCRELASASLKQHPEDAGDLSDLANASDRDVAEAFLRGFASSALARMALDLEQA